jgi:hypothetical protein
MTDEVLDRSDMVFDCLEKLNAPRINRDIRRLRAQLNRSIMLV